MIGPDGNPVPGGYSEFEASLVRRAAFERNLSERHIFLDYSPPSAHGGERWNVRLGENSGPGTETICDTWSYWNKTYEAGLRRLAARDYVWKKPWQESLQERIAYLPWDANAPWFTDPDPQRAWQTCPNGRHLLWVISQDSTIRKEDLRVRACALQFAHVASSAAHTLRLPLNSRTYEIYSTFGERRDPRIEVATRWASVKDEEPWGLQGEALSLWHYDRTVLYAALAAFGNLGRLDDTAYHAMCLEYAVWKDDPEYVQRKFTGIVRHHFHQELFTRP